MLVLAGAGSGKTRVITCRLAQLMRRGVKPTEILAVTFTNKAAREMGQRAKGLVGKSVKGLTISTFHALGAQLLRRFGHHVALRPSFSIGDGGDQLGTMRRILRQLRIDDRRFDARRIMQLISHAKNAGVSAAEFRRLGGTFSGEPPECQAVDDEYRLATIEAFDKYEAALIAQNVVDFDDLLLLSLRLLREQSSVRTALHSKWRYFMIDEYQDTNGAQLEMMRLLSSASGNLCVVGDDDQSIYGWRGANMENILQFERHFPGAKVVTLEMNYRSTGSILAVANEIIGQNTKRHDKTLRAAAGQGEPVRIVSHEDEEREAEWVASRIVSVIAEGTTPKDVAVLYRSNTQARAIELALRMERVAYRVVGGMELFDRREIKDALAYLRVLANPQDEQSLRRIINYPPRGIGTGSIEKLDDWGRRTGHTLTEALESREAYQGLDARAIRAVDDLASMLKTHRRLLRSRKASTVMKKLFEAVGLEEALLGSSDGAQAASRRVDNVREIVKQLERYERRHGGGQDEDDEIFDEFEVPAEEEGEVPRGLARLRGFLSDLALAGMDAGSTKDERNDQVVLSTVHAAKGLEWAQVFLVGAEEELMPHRRSVELGDVEEERRLAYVAVTRAREQLWVSHTRTRTRWGKVERRTRSRFFEDLSEAYTRYSEDGVVVAKNEAEQQAIEHAWRAKIRAQLGIEGPDAGADRS